MGGVLTDGTVEGIFVFAISGDLGPVDAVAVTIDPAEVALGFEDEDSPLVYGQAVDLKEGGVGDDVIFDVMGARFGVGFGEIGVNQDVLGSKILLQAVDEAGFGGSELDGIGRGEVGIGDLVGWCDWRISVRLIHNLI